MLIRLCCLRLNLSQSLDDCVVIIEHYTYRHRIDTEPHDITEIK